MKYMYGKNEVCKGFFVEKTGNLSEKKKEMVVQRGSRKVAKAVVCLRRLCAENGKAGRLR